MKLLITLLPAALIFILLNGCSTPQKNNTNQQTDTQSQPLEASAETLIKQAINSNNPTERANKLLLAAQKYYTNNLVSQSSAAIKDIDVNFLSSEKLIQALLLNLELGIDADIEWHQRKAIEIHSIASFNKINIDSLKAIIPLLSETYLIQDQPTESAILLIEYAGIIDHIDTELLNDKIWSRLRQTELIHLSNYNYSGDDTDVIAWLELLKSIQQNQINLESQYRAFNDWKQKWPNHPATATPPKELLLLSKLPETRPAEIIIALPLTGPVAKAGKAVRDGFMAGYINEQKSSDLNTTRISFFDTNKLDIESLYSQPLTKNSLIVGPLTKSNVNKLTKLDLSNTTTLALNYLETDHTSELPNENLFQFGLNPEAEINQLAAQLTKKNLNKIAFIAPENEHGFRIHDTLQEALHHNQSIIIESVYYNDQKSLSPSVARLLATDLSSQRKSKISRITNLSFEFEPRRRNDIDAIFMLAKPKIASQLNPLFAYHYARNLPIYSSSQIHEIDQHQNDLDNIYFVEMPWMLSNTIETKNTIANAIPTSNKDYSRFYALGADAFSLSPRLKLLKEIQHSQIQGHTGTLSIDQFGVIHRELELAVFKKGKAIKE